MIDVNTIVVHRTKGQGKVTARFMLSLRGPHSSAHPLGDSVEFEPCVRVRWTDAGTEHFRLCDLAAWGIREMEP